jgi:hypothetical protein
MKLIKYLKELTIIEFLIIIAILLVGSGHYYIKNSNQAEVNLIENKFQSESVVNNLVRAKISHANKYYAGKFNDYYVFTNKGRIFLMKDTWLWFDLSSSELYRIALSKKNKTCSFEVKNHWWYGWTTNSIKDCKLIKD